MDLQTILQYQEQARRFRDETVLPAIVAGEATIKQIEAGLMGWRNLLGLIDGILAAQPELHASPEQVPASTTANGREPRPNIGHVIDLASYLTRPRGDRIEAILKTMGGTATTVEIMERLESMGDKATDRHAFWSVTDSALRSGVARGRFVKTAKATWALPDHAPVATAKTDDGASRKAASPRSKKSLAVLIEEILKGSGKPMGTTEIRSELYQRGEGDLLSPRMFANTIYSAVSRRPDLFKKLEDKRWALVGSKT